MDRGNPLSRKVLKKEAKRARRAATRAQKVEGGGMDVDDEAALEFTFMAGVDSVAR
jgi:nuclear GTP-binding protein